MKGLNIIIIGIILLSLDTMYLTYYLYNKFGGLSNIFSFDKENQVKIEFWIDYLFHSMGGLILGCSILCIITGYIIYNIEDRLSEKKKKQRVDDFMNRLNK